VSGWGNTPGRDRIKVAIAVDGIKRHEITAIADQTYELSIEIPHGGQNIIELSMQPFPGELSTANNRAIAIIQGIRDRLRVLLVSGQPHPGERTWRNLLKADPSVDLVHFTILRPPNKQDNTPINELSLIAFPTRELFSKKLKDFDLVIFDRYARHGVLPSIYLFNIAEYITNGGAVLVAAGPDYAGASSLYHSALGDVLPAKPDGVVTTGPFRPLLTTSGSRHPISRGLKGGDTKKPTWGKWFRLIDSTATTGTTLMTGLNDKPVLVIAKKGNGRIAQLLSDQSWLWARGFDGGGPQAELLRRIAHWLMKQPELEQEALSGIQKGQTLLITRQTMADKPAAVTISSPDGKTENLVLTMRQPGLWQGQTSVSKPGIYTLSDGKKIAFAGFGNPDPLENRFVHSTSKLVMAFAAKTSSAIRRIDKASPRVAMVKPGRAMFGSGWVGLKRNNAYSVTSIKTIPLFSTLLGLALLLGLIGLTWYREGR